jgi:molybdenum cofactor cytidylyltransferase
VTKQPSAQRLEPIVGILLAAGSATRFGGDKLLARLEDGTPVGVAALNNLAGVVDVVVAVVRPDDDVLAGLLSAQGARVSACPDSAEGMGASLRWGVRASPLAAAWIIALADMPWIAPQTIARVTDALRAGALLAAPRVRGTRGHPVGIAARFYAELVDLSGDEGAKNLVSAHAASLQWIDVDDPGILCDVDIPGDLAR